MASETCREFKSSLATGRWLLAPLLIVCAQVFAQQMPPNLTLNHRRAPPSDEVDPFDHLIGTAVGWGGNPHSEADYQSYYPPRNDGTTVYRLTMKDVPVDAFWSISLYNAKGYFEINDLNAYSVNNLTAKSNADGSFTIQFGGCGSGVPNCLAITPGWYYTVRLYRPRKEILDGTWRLPEPQPVG